MEVTKEMIDEAEMAQSAPGDESFWIHLGHATYEQMIKEGIIKEYK